jgi:DNA-damage-inducible protein J
LLYKIADKNKRGDIMARSAMIHARTETSLKAEVEAVFKELGLTTTEAINLFFNQVRIFKGLPFDVRIPNEETLQAIDDIRNKRNLTHYKNKKEMFKDLGI